MANPRKLRAIYTSNCKTDKTDAHMIARLARVDPTLLHPIQHSSEQAQRDLLQVKLRDNLVRQRVDIISSVRFTLKSMGLKIASPNTDCFAKRCRKTHRETDPVLLAGEALRSCREDPMRPRNPNPIYRLEVNFNFQLTAFSWKPRQTTPTSRFVDMIFCNYNLNPVIDARPRW